MAVLYAKAAGGNWSSANTWSTTGSGGVDNSGPPTAATDVIFSLLSGTVTIDAASSCRSLDTTSGVGTFGGTITHNAFTLSIGDATSGAANVALKLNSGITYTLTNVATSAISFISTNTTQQTVDFGSKSAGNITFGVSGTPNYAVTTALAMDATATLTSTFGHLHMDGATDNSGLTHNIGKWASSASNVRTINLGTSSIICTGTGTWWNMSTTANITFSGGSSTITQTGTATGQTVTFTSGNKTYGTLNLASAAESTITTSNAATVTITNVTRTGTPGASGNNILSLGVPAGGILKVTGNLTVTGTSAALRANIWPNSNGFPGGLDVSGATLNLQYVGFQDVTFNNGGVSLDLSAITGGSGDEGGNTIIGGGTLTFTTPITQYWLTTGAGNWSDVTKWTSRIPLPQDPVVFDTVFTGSPTIVMDVSFGCGTMDASASTGNFTLNGSLATTNIIGTFVGRSGMTISGNIYFNSRLSTDTFTRGGASVTAGVQISSSNGGTITFLDNTIFAAVQHRSGIIVIPSNITVSFNTYVSNATNSTAPCLVTINGTLNLGSSGTIFSLANAASLTTVNGSGTIGITSVNGSSKTFAGGGNTYPNIRITGGGAGAVIFTGANTLASLSVIGGTKSITLPGSTTTTLLSGNGLGNQTNVVTFVASAGSATVAKTAGRVSWDYVSLTNIPASGSATFYAGANSTDGGGNTNWLFQAPPAASSSAYGFGRGRYTGIPFNQAQFGVGPF